MLFYSYLPARIIQPWTLRRIYGMGFRYVFIQVKSLEEVDQLELTMSGDHFLTVENIKETRRGPLIRLDATDAKGRRELEHYTDIMRELKKRGYIGVYIVSSKILEKMDVNILYKLGVTAINMVDKISTREAIELSRHRFTIEINIDPILDFTGDWCEYLRMAQTFDKRGVLTFSTEADEYRVRDLHEVPKTLETMVIRGLNRWWRALW